MPSKKPNAHLFHQHVWRHNSFMGMAKMMQVQASNIARAPSTSREAKKLAEDIMIRAQELDKALRAERIDP
jgi:predicted outer membrane protein